VAALGALLPLTPARATDGVIEIDQARALAGSTLQGSPSRSSLGAAFV
jgi:hypothetical protein